MGKTNTGIIGFVIILVLGMIVYSYFFQNDAVLTLTSSGQDISTLGADLVKIQDELNKANLNSQIFSDPGYVNLKDFSATTTPQPLGRPNPFEVMGR